MYFKIKKTIGFYDKIFYYMVMVFYVVYEQRERVFHRDIQTRENNGECMSAKRECFCSLFSSVWISRWDTSSSCSYGFSNESRRNRMFFGLLI